METNVVQYRRKKWINDFEGLNRSVEVLVIDGVFIVPHPRIWPCNLVSNEYDAIVARIRLDLIHYGAGSGPGHDSRLHSHGRAERRKCEIARAAADSELTIGDIVVHVALPRMGLTPGVFTWGDVLCFGKIGRAGILRWLQVGHCYCHSMRRTGVIVAGMIVRARRERPCKWIYPRA